MTTEHDARTRTVVSWLREDAHENAERVLLAALNEVDTTQQRRAGWPAWRLNPMPTAAKTALAAAAMIVVAVGALAFLQRPSGPGATVTPSPTTEPAPTLTAAPSVGILTMPRSGPIPAGTYRMGEEASIVLAVPSGWSARAGDNYPTGTDIRKHRDEPGELGLWVDASDQIGVYPDICATDKAPPPAGPTVDDLVTALRAQRGSETSEPADVTIGGRVVQRYEISFGQGIDIASCEPGIARVWFSEASGYIASVEPTTDTVYMVQTGAGRIVFGIGRRSPDASAADIAELDAMIESMVIAP